MRAAPGALLDPATLADPYPFLAWAREHEPVFHVDVLNEAREVVLSVTKTLYIRRKPPLTGFAT